MPHQSEIKQLAGALNLDDPLETLGKAVHRDARNIVFKGTPPNRRVELVQGVSLITNSLLPSGTNKTIFHIYDPIYKRIYFGNFNFQGKSGIYLYDTIAQTFSRLVEVSTNTIGDPLAFTAESLCNVDILYGDGSLGPILHFLDSLGRPTKINIDRALSGGYGNIYRSFLDVAKEPASIPPVVVYENDATLTINNLRKKLFRFKVRWVFDDQDKSVTSSQSLMPIPYNAFDQTTDTDPTKNCRIAVVYQTGPSNVKKVEILAANSDGNSMSDFYLVASLDKAELQIPDNDISTFLFYNDKGYTNITTTESDQLYDYVPPTAGAQALLNGNVVAYGNVTEGYPNLSVFSYNGGTESFIGRSRLPWFDQNFFIEIVANQGGDSGYSSGFIHIAIRGTNYDSSGTPDQFIIYMVDGSSIEYNTAPGDDISSIIEGLRVDAIANGYSIGDVGSNDLYITKSGASLARALCISQNTYNQNLNTSFPVHDWTSNYGFGLVYFDEKERTNGTVYADGFSVTSFGYGEVFSNTDIPAFTPEIYHQPPIWATHYQWVRTKNLSKLNFVQWVSDRTFKDLGVAPGTIASAYISIETLNTFVSKNPGSPLSYSFTPGDRIRFFKRINADGSSANVYVDGKDFELTGSLVNPTINGGVKEGQFVKLVLPSTDGNFDFGVAGYDYYFIELYTPAQPVANNLNLYYEFGERYTVGYPGTAQRLHQGQMQDQQLGVQPATFLFTKGDFYIRPRAIQVGNIYTWNIPNVDANGFRFLIPLNFVGSTYSDPNVTAKSVPLVGLGFAFDPTTDSRWALSANANTTFRIKGSVAINFVSDRAGDTWQIYTDNIYGDELVLSGPQNCATAGTYNFLIDTTITLENDRIFILAKSFISSDRQIKFLTSSITAPIENVINQQCIDPNFSDYYPSKVNSNGRAFIYDENANTVTFPTMYRWGLKYQEDTNVNQINRFYPENFDTVDRSKGAIKKMLVWDRVLTIFQERKVGWTGVYQKYITDNDGTSQLATTNSIITPNNIQYYSGEFGVGNQPTSVVRSGFVYYFVDPIKNKILRLSRDGITDLTEIYKVQSWGSRTLPKYLNPGNYQFGGKQKVLGVYNLRPDNIGEYIILAQGTALTAGESFAFEENYNAFTSPYDIDCDALECAENVLYMFRGGALYKQSSSAPYATFFGVPKTASITLPFVDKEGLKKVYLALGYQANMTWVAPAKGDVKTNTVNSQTALQQESLIMEEDFDTLENPSRYAAFNKDQNSGADAVVSLWEGDELTGNLMTIKLSLSSTSFAYLYLPYITWIINQRNF